MPAGPSKILIVDAGSTKMEWILLDGEKVEDRFVTEGFNPNYADRQCLEDRLSLVESRLIASSCDDPTFPRRDDSALLQLQGIWYYGTGCGNEGNCQIVKTAFRHHFTEAEIHVTHDLMAVCHAVLGRRKGIACILGTGSNSCVYDGTNIVEKGVSLGYLVGDEGSGMHIGREVVRAYFYGLMPDDLREAFAQTYHLSRDEFIDNLYHNGQPSRYLASFAPFAGENQAHPFVHDLVKTCFKAFVQTFVSRYNDYKTMEVSFVGSIAHHFQGILEETLADDGIRMGEVMPTPAEGLIRYHQNPQA